MVVYEITANVESELVRKFENYMRKRHIPDVMRTGYFGDWKMEELEAGEYLIRYYCVSESKLNEYLADHAETLRQDFVKHFPNGVRVSRRSYPETSVSP